ncbi:hypothetical protein [Cysteiniphilum sp. QT6929]|uniref:hypothetical protein n=1 Tax=Cysteiniphilum sp. QT6929 TaxID=2975055 RepID=UPI0024B39B13|nr:hypothetical protein [Cysteiniphilum sp. QT6929]WHN66047.1 hypothetical protein NYP54_02130 [Cysteiniphilum sp. QT6929]
MNRYVNIGYKWVITGSAEHEAYILKSKRAGNFNPVYITSGNVIKVSDSSSIITNANNAMINLSNSELKKSLSKMPAQYQAQLGQSEEELNIIGEDVSLVIDLGNTSSFDACQHNIQLEILPKLKIELLALQYETDRSRNLVNRSEHSAKLNQLSHKAFKLMKENFNSTCLDQSIYNILKETQICALHYIEAKTQTIMVSRKKDRVARKLRLCSELVVSIDQLLFGRKGYSVDFLSLIDSAPKVYSLLKIHYKEKAEQILAGCMELWSASPISTPQSVLSGAIPIEILANLPDELKPAALNDAFYTQTIDPAINGTNTVLSVVGDIANFIYLGRKLYSEGGMTINDISMLTATILTTAKNSINIVKLFVDLKIMESMNSVAGYSSAICSLPLSMGYTYVGTKNSYRMFSRWETFKRLRSDHNLSCYRDLKEINLKKGVRALILALGGAIGIVSGVTSIICLSGISAGILPLILGALATLLGLSLLLWRFGSYIYKKWTGTRSIKRRELANQLMTHLIMLHEESKLSEIDQVISAIADNPTIKDNIYQGIFSSENETSRNIAIGALTDKLKTWC